MKKMFLGLFYILLLVSAKVEEEQTIEVPLRTVRVKGIPKYGNIVFDDPDFDDNQDDDLILRASEGEAIFNTAWLYIASLSIGSSNQPFNLLLDTGSPIIWVGILGSYDQYPLTHHYNPTISTTSKNTMVPFSMKYGSGSCNGYYYIDRFTYPGNNKFSVRFGAAQNTEFNVPQGDGIIGLSRNYREENLSFIHSLKAGQITNSLAFSLKFNVVNNYIVGKMILGKDPDFSKSNIATCPLVTKSGINPIFWMCKLSTFGLKSAKASQTFNINTDVIFDTGTNNIMLPTSVFEQVRGKLGKFNCGYQESYGSYRIICDLNNYFPDFTLTFNGHEFTLPRNIMYHRLNNNQIFAAIIFSDSIPAPIIGSPFFVAFHTLFDHQSNHMTFAPAYGTFK